MDIIFGKPQKKDDDSTQGKIKIFPANLLALPMRATDSAAFYYYVSNDEMIDMFNMLNENLGINVSINAVLTDKEVSVEGFQCKTTSGFSGLVSNDVAIMTPEQFKEVPLPVVARNNINNGKNLWYEEIVPHKSVFYFYALAADEDSSLMEIFSKAICSSPVQFGGNASVGCGFTKITEISSGEAPKNE
jgi:CRISPR-associated protein Cmr4